MFGLTENKNQENIVGLSREELNERFLNLGLKKFRSGQVWHWLYHKGVTSFEEMTTLSKTVREQLRQKFAIKRPMIIEKQTSMDGTIKWLLQFEDGTKAETVFIPEEDRGTLCISSQVGCTLNCSFCHTGTQRLVRNLTPSELVGQILIAFDELSAWPSAQAGRPVTNIVLMGMGEPLYNLDNVITALKIVMDNEGISISKRRITLSTSGIVPEIYKCGLETDVNLAISLHAVTDDVRNILVPINKKYPIKDLLRACREYPGVSNSRRITFEYVMLKGINDSISDAKALIKLMEGIPAKINLIPFNPWPGSPYERSEKSQIEQFAKIILKAGYPSPVRTPRGDDILAACGQLKSGSVKEKRSKRRYDERLLEAQLP
ncbi:MAG: 23S rRNA (adenine(2503)-C(2))-methyltransferase RlmN [Pseudomonadota bacterium]|nr:23S rRNA (adenine(2503)-C(2))-methyltransferase RlmN [Pseudomonadota bacterium]